VGVLFLLDGLALGRKDDAGDNWIMRAIKEKKENVVRALSLKASEYDSRDLTGVTPLMAVAKYGSSNLLKFWLDRQAYGELNQTDHAGNTALHFAIETGSTEKVLSILVRGALVGIQNNANETPRELLRHHRSKYSKDDYRLQRRMLKGK